MTDWAIRAYDREALKAFIRSVKSLGRRGAPVLEIVLPCCGEIRRYRQEIDLPVNDVLCPCGNWFIKYEEQPLRVVF